MQRALVIEQSATVRHSITRSLAEYDLLVSECESFAAAIEQLSAPNHHRTLEYDAIVIGWSSYAGPEAEYLFSTLCAQHNLPLTVFVLSNEDEFDRFNWLKERSRSCLMRWSDVELVGARLKKHLMIEPSRDSKLVFEWQDVEPLRGPRVLFVDDSKTARASVQGLLDKNGYHVDVASDINQGMDMALAKDYDLAIIDYFMPGGHGDELCRRLRANPRTADITTSIYTSTYLDTVIKRSLEAGAVECMFKNESEALFLARVNAMARVARAKIAVEREHQYMEGILGSVGDGVYGVDIAGRIIFMNPAAKRILGFRDDEYLGQHPHELFHYAFADGMQNPTSTCFLSKAYTSGDRLENWHTDFWTVDKRTIPVECTVQPLEIGDRREGTVVAFRDVSERRLMEEELRWQANHDPLTKLLNRRYFEHQLEQEVTRLTRSTENSALLYIDLDKFKYINDSAGHAAGDQLLIEIAQCLQSRIRASDLLARLGGDEFAFILRNIEPEQVYDAADKFRVMLSNHTFSYQGRHFNINGSIGVALINRETGSASDVMSAADLAANIAKEKGRNQTHIYNSERDESRALDMELGWSSRLQNALSDDLFKLAYQPILPMGVFTTLLDDQAAEASWSDVLHSLGEQKLHCEVLLRLPGVDNSEILPGAFLPSAERFNLMRDIDDWVLDKAISELGIQNRLGNRVSFSINLSVDTIVEKHSSKRIKALIRDNNVNPEDLVFEISEASAIANIDAAQKIIKELRDFGCQFALDNFGSGFCSFGHLKHLDVNTVKIDGPCIQGVVSDSIDQEVVIAINQIAHSSGKKTVAEYVESGDILRKISEYGVDFAQGYHVSEPMFTLPDRNRQEVLSRVIS